MNAQLAISGLFLIVIGLIILVITLVDKCKNYQKDLKQILRERTNIVKLYAYSLDLRQGSIDITQTVRNGFLRDAELLNDVYEAFTKVQLAAASSSDATLKAMAPGMDGILKVMKETADDRCDTYRILSDHISNVKNNIANRKAFLYKKYAEIMKEFDEENSSQHEQTAQKNEQDHHAAE